MMNDPSIDKLAIEIMGWELYGRIVPNDTWKMPNGDLTSRTAWNPRTRWDHAGMLEKKMGERGFWLELKSPFYPGQPYFAGFTPHDTTGWNGIPDHHGVADTGPGAIFKAAYATLPEIAL